MRPGARLAAALAVATTGLVACQLLVGVEDEPQNPRPEAGTAVDGAIESGADAGVSCAHARPPGPPNTGEANPTNTYYFAVRAVKIEGFPELPNAFDFDDRCSCENREPEKTQTSCKLGRDPCAQPATDDPEGRDLGGQNALAAARSFLPDLERDDINPKFEKGVTGLILRISDYNDSPNDRSVGVSLGISNGIELSNVNAKATPRSRDEACAGFEVDGGLTPAWDGKDVWYASNSVGTGSIGYVRDGVLVIDGAQTAYELTLSGQTLRQSRSVFVAKIDRSSPVAKLRGNLVGLVKSKDLLSIIGTFRSPTGPIRVCEDPFVLPLFGKSICEHLDLSSEGDPGAACDSIAIAFGIDAVQIDPPGTNPACAPFDGGVPCNVSCAGFAPDAGRD